MQEVKGESPQWAKSLKRLKIQCHVVKNTLPQTASDNSVNV